MACLNVNYHYISCVNVNNHYIPHFKHVPPSLWCKYIWNNFYIIHISRHLAASTLLFLPKCTSTHGSICVCSDITHNSRQMFVYTYMTHCSTTWQWDKSSHKILWVTWITYRENNHDQNIQNNRSHIPAVQIIFHSTHSHMFDRVKWSFSQKSHHYMAKFLAIGYRSAEEKNLMNALLKEFASSIMNSHLQKLSPRKLKTILIWKPSAITNCSFG